MPMKEGDTVRVNPVAWRVGNDAARVGIITRRVQPDWASWDWDMWEVQFPSSIRADGREYGEGGRIHWFKGTSLEVV